MADQATEIQTNPEESQSKESPREESPKEEPKESPREESKEPVEETPASPKGDSSPEHESSGLRKRKDTEESKQDEKKDAAPVTARRMGGASPLENVKSVTSQAVEYAKNPDKLVPIIRSHLDTHVPHDLLLIFLFIWFPLIVIAVGSVAGQLIHMIFQHLHFVIGLAAAGYVFQLHALRSKTGEGLHSKFLQIFLIASVLPILMIHESNFFFRLFTLIAFIGTPFLLKRYFLEGPKKSDDPKPEREAQDQYFLSGAAAPAVIFTLSVGGVGYWNALAIAPVFALAAVASYRSIDMLLERLVPLVPEPHRDLVKANKLVVFALEELLIANVVLGLFSWILIPQSILDEQSGFFGVLFISLLGLILLAVSTVLGSQQIIDGLIAKFKLPAPVLDLAVKVFTGAVVGSLALLLVEHVLKLLEL